MHLCYPSLPSSLACPPPPQPWLPSPCQPLPSTSAFVFASLAALSLASTSALAAVAIAQTLLTADGSRNRPDRQARRRRSPGETATRRRTAPAARRGPLHNHRRLLLLLPWLGRHDIAKAHGEARTSSAMESASIWISSGRRPRGSASSTRRSAAWSRVSTAWCAGLCAYLAASTPAIRGAGEPNNTCPPGDGGANPRDGASAPRPDLRQQRRPRIERNGRRNQWPNDTKQRKKELPFLLTSRPQSWGFSLLACLASLGSLLLFLSPPSALLYYSLVFSLSGPRLE